MIASLELSRVCQQQGGNHLYNTKQLCVLNDEQIVLAEFRISFVTRSEPRIDANNVSQGFNERQTLEKKEWNLLSTTLQLFRRPCKLG